MRDDPTTEIPVTRALRRSRGRWRIFAFLALALVVLVGIARFVPFSQPGQIIARVTISGTIFTSAERTALLDRLAEDDSVAAVIVAINSPGGSSAGGEELYESLRRISEQKPIVSVVGELGASAAYMAAVGTDRIWARNLSIIGSIGVYVPHVDAGQLFETIGIDLDRVASGPMKSAPDYDESYTPETRQVIERLVDSSFDYFFDLVVAERDLPASTQRLVADGRIVSGIDALELGLVDATGGEIEAIQWLSENHEIDAELPVVEVWPRETRPTLLDFVLGQSSETVLSYLRRFGLQLDGLASLWHPSAR